MMDSNSAESPHAHLTSIVSLKKMVMETCKKKFVFKKTIDSSANFNTISKIISSYTFSNHKVNHYHNKFPI